MLVSATESKERFTWDCELGLLVLLFLLWFKLHFSTWVCVEFIWMLLPFIVYGFIGDSCISDINNNPKYFELLL